MRFAADVVQSCVATLEPVGSRVEDRFEVAFVPPDPALGQETQRPRDLGGEEPLGQVVGGVIDIGGPIAEHLSLAIDPYPRKPGAGLGARQSPDGRPDVDESGPFAALSKWRGKA